MHMEMSPTGVLGLPNVCIKSSLEILHIRPGFESEDRNASPGNCPWCLAKGQTNALRFYAMNLKETVLLCTNPACLYPLVSRSLDEVRASLSKDGCKRTISSLSDVNNVSSPPKRPREEKPDVSEPCVAEVNDATLPEDAVDTQMFTDEQSVPAEAISIDDTEDQQPEELPAATHEDLDLCERKDDRVSSTQDEDEEIFKKSSKLVPVQPHLFWKNEDNLCWLDSMLVMLVHCRTIRETPCQNVRLIDKLPTVPCDDSAVWNFCSTYDKTCAFLKAREQQRKGKVSRVAADVLDVVERRLSALRLSVFNLLQPTLKCEIGQMETPVFALPLLLRSDKWAQDIFQHTIRWEFKCVTCDHTVNESVEKTLTTFTHIMNDWHPLKAVHRTQCNNCDRKHQRRIMVLEKLSSVFALHFVEGLPRKDLSKYAFMFRGRHYNVSTVIQYNKDLQHFVTWVRQSNGSWLELDDLKHPHSSTHKRFPFSSNEFHIVFWEADSMKEDHEEVCSPTAPSVVTNVTDEQPLNMSNSVDNDKSVISALTVKDSTATSALNLSIGSTTLLNTFEELSHKDTVTLTLVDPTPTENLQVPQRQTFVQTARPDPFVTSGLLSCLSKPVRQPSNPPIPQSSVSVIKPVVATSSKVHAPLPVSFQSTPVRPPAPKPQPILKCANNEALPAKPAEMFGGFKTKRSPNSSGADPAVVPQHKQISPPGGVCPTVKKPSSLLADQLPISTTEALRMKLMKKLKAKKKKLAKLNQLLGNGGESAPKPDSTAVSSPYSVTSSTSAMDNTAYDQFFADLLSPATTVSNLSPDSTGLLEMLNNGQNSETPVAETAVATVPEASLTCPSSIDDSILPLDEYMQSEMCQTAMDNTDFNALDIFF